MLEIKQSILNIKQILDSPDYYPLILPSKLPHVKQSDLPWVAIEARLEGQLIGLALTEVYDEGFFLSASLCSVVISPSHQKKGIGRSLFAFTEQHLKEKEGITFLKLFYTQEDQYSQAVEKILSSLNWGTPQTATIHCHFDFTLFNPPWMYRIYRLPSSMNFFCWKELKSSDRKEINYLVQQRRVSPYLSPFVDEEDIEKETSVGLRHHEEIVGWSITHRTTPLTLVYRSLYLDSTFLGTGYGIQLLIESLQRHKRSGIPNALFEIDPNDIEPTWAYFIKKRLYPLANKIEHIKKAFKTLRQSQEIN